MANIQDNEPSLEKIEDYDGKESPSKRNTVRLVIVILLIIGAFFAYIRNDSYESAKKEYVGSPEKPGITNINNK